MMTKDLLPGSRGLSYAKQQEMVQDLNKIKQTDYRVPNAGRATICMVTHYLTSGKRSFKSGDGASRYDVDCEGKVGVYQANFTRCQESVGQERQVIIGALDLSGLVVNYSTGDHGDYGIAAMREL